ncbi:triphosphate tunel metalloenzyme 3-like [Cucumis melo var. makuwa]|uniref:Triphosphate tunel metalloenzyme 3-like n=2 Tax=Cucumis melo TaxID=3656 RepID=A0A5A7TTB9_CUCMM|nr:triphosphate tunnel metalloenzyme 3-like [Cucumis melo]KAA0044469.1 triphosphate tunel metalloenzyme 3-like [Cucumis melo var. makuwa]
MIATHKGLKLKALSPIFWAPRQLEMSLRLLPNSGHPSLHLRRNCRLFYDLRPTNQQPPPPMEVEIKLRLPDSSSHHKLSHLLSSHHIKTHNQHNFFFDGPNAELSSNHAALRIRLYDEDSHCVLSLKAKPIISDGISRIEEEEEALEPSIGRACVEEPNRMLLMEESKILERVKEEYGVDGFVCLGGFKNERRVYEWKGLKLELDETIFEFGRNYEMECESEDAERDRDLLEGFMKENGIRYSYSQSSKFAIFRSGKLPPFS